MYTTNISTRVRAPANNRLQTSPSMTNNHYHDETALNLTRRATSETRAPCTTPFLRCKQTMKMCSFNARTLNQSHSLVELCVDSKRYNLDLTAIQEHRQYHTEESIRIQEISKEYTLITASAFKNSANATTGGVGFLISNKHTAAITAINKISKRIIKIDLAGNPSTTVLSCHSPHNESSDQDAEEFYEALSDAIEDIPAHNVLFVLGDFNAKIGPLSSLFTYNGSTNRNGTHLLDLLESHQLQATNLTLQKARRRLWTFKYPNGTKAQLDYFLVRKKWSKTVLDVNAVNTTYRTIQSDHRPIVATIQLKLRSSRQPKSKTPRPNFKLLKDDAELQTQYAVAVLNRFEVLANSTPLDETNYSILGKACTEVGYQLLPQRKPEKWNNIATRPPVIQARKNMHQAIKSGSRQRIRREKKKLQKAYTSEQTKMIENKTKKLEEKYFHNKHSEAWKIIREISGGSDTPLRISTLGSAAQNKDNWQKHFSELLGNISQPPGESFEPIVRIIDTELPINTSSFTMDELDNALGKSKSNAVGPDNIPLEIWKSEMFKSKLLQLCNRTYVDNNLKPKEWSKSNIVPIHKKRQ